jgi:hypothetical protein
VTNREAKALGLLIILSFCGLFWAGFAFAIGALAGMVLR